MHHEKVSVKIIFNTVILIIRMQWHNCNFASKELYSPMTIDQINHLVGQETLHPLVCVAHLPETTLPDKTYKRTGFYALTLDDAHLYLSVPGEPFEKCMQKPGCTGVFFHPDLLCDTPLEHNINRYPTRCRCNSTLTERECKAIMGCMQEIDKELHHAIDRYSRPIIVSHIELLLNYCVRFCNQ